MYTVTTYRPGKPSAKNQIDGLENAVLNLAECRLYCPENTYVLTDHDDFLVPTNEILQVITVYNARLQDQNDAAKDMIRSRECRIMALTNLFEKID